MPRPAGPEGRHQLRGAHLRDAEELLDIAAVRRSRSSHLSERARLIRRGRAPRPALSMRFPATRWLARSAADSPQKRNCRVTFTAKARFSNIGKPRFPMFVKVSRWSLWTMNSSLPGSYSQRRRTFLLSTLLVELYCSNALANIRGVKV